MADPSRKINTKRVLDRMFDGTTNLQMFFKLMIKGKKGSSDRDIRLQEIEQENQRCYQYRKKVALASNPANNPKNYGKNSLLSNNLISQNNPSDTKRKHQNARDEAGIQTNGMEFYIKVVLH